MSYRTIGLHLKFSTDPHQPLFGGKSPTTLKSTLDYMCQIAFEKSESFKSNGEGRDSYGADNLYFPVI